MFDILYGTACGRLTATPEIRKGKDDSPYATFSVAINTDKDKVTYVSVIAFGYLAEKVLPELDKGERVTCIGEMELVQPDEKKEGGKANLRMVLEKIFLGTPKKAQKATENGESVPSYQSLEDSETNEYY